MLLIIIVVTMVFLTLDRWPIHYCIGHRRVHDLLRKKLRAHRQVHMMNGSPLWEPLSEDCLLNEIIELERRVVRAHTAIARCFL